MSTTSQDYDNLSADKIAILKRYIEVYEIHKKLDKELTELKNAILSDIFKNEPGKISVEGTDKSVECIVYERKNFDQARFKKEFDNLYQQFVYVAKITSVRVVDSDKISDAGDSK